MKYVTGEDRWGNFAAAVVQDEEESPKYSHGEQLLVKYIGDNYPRDKNRELSTSFQKETPY